GADPVLLLEAASRGRVHVRTGAQAGGAGRLPAPRFLPEPDEADPGHPRAALEARPDGSGRAAGAGPAAPGVREARRRVPGPLPAPPERRREAARRDRPRVRPGPRGRAAPRARVGAGR